VSTARRAILAQLPLSIALAAAPACAKAFRDAPRPTAPAAEAFDRLAELWADPGDVTALDLVNGPGGAALRPAEGGSFTFVAEDTSGFSPGWDVRDASGLQWDVKLGPEAQSEVVASRILWAMGYRQPPTYYVARWTLEGGPRPGPGQPARFRPDVAGARRAGEWSWERNPFAGTQAFRGLLVLMRLINNWDLLDRNTAVYEFSADADVPRWYVVLDLGASFGRTRTLSRHSGTRNDPDGFEEQGFIEKVGADGYVEFDQLGKWHRGLFTRIRPDDVRWACERLARLSDRQWQDAFRAAGYDGATAERFIRTLRARVAEGMALPTPPAGEPTERN
jgi:hypothetical protein